MYSNCLIEIFPKNIIYLQKGKKQNTDTETKKKNIIIIIIIIEIKDS